jgi:hypothetical protein
MGVSSCRTKVWPTGIITEPEGAAAAAVEGDCDMLDGTHIAIKTIANNRMAALFMEASRRIARKEISLYTGLTLPIL